MSKLREIVSNLWGIRVKKVKSALNGKLEVWYISRHLQLDAENVNYSYGSLHRLFRKVFQEINLPALNPSSLLLLGLGAGSVVSILRNEFRMTTKITGVDHDQVVIDLAKKYFAIEQFSGLDIVCRDALEYVSDANHEFDAIVIDLFRNQVVPDKFRSELFIRHCLRLLPGNGVLMFNFIVKTRKEQKEFDQLVDLFRLFPGKTSILEVFGTNKVIVYRKGV